MILGSPDTMLPSVVQRDHLNKQQKLWRDINSIMEILIGENDLIPLFHGLLPI